jgi:uncharacterized protein (UPF0332 family)
MERAEESIKAAKDLIKGAYYDFAASRAFYAATATLVHENFKFRKHSAVISAIHQQYVKTGKLDKKFGKDLNWLFELRSVGDYGSVIHVPQQDAEKAIEAAELFINAIEKLIKRKKL